MGVTVNWQIAAPIIGSIVASALFYYLSHRERIEVKHANMSVQLLIRENVIIGIQIKYSKGLIMKYMQ